MNTGRSRLDGGPALPADPDLVRRALAGSARVGPFFAVSLTGEGRDWRPAAEVYAGGLAGPIRSTGEQLGVTESRVAAATVHLGYAARLWSPVLYCALCWGLVPDLAGLRLATSPSIRLSLPEPRGWRAEGQAALAALAYRVVADQHLEPLARGLTVKIAGGLLRGNAAAAMTAALRVLVASQSGPCEPTGTGYAAETGLDRAARAMAQTLLGTGILRGTGELTGPGLEFRRRSCCLFYRVPGGGLCGDCPLPARPSREDHRPPGG
ncbi:MAG: (2Fe-2S)-binding protein [Streptosporangiaceae bacterium]